MVGFTFSLSTFRSNRFVYGSALSPSVTFMFGGGFHDFCGFFFSLHSLIGCALRYQCVFYSIFCYCLQAVGRISWFASVARQNDAWFFREVVGGDHFCQVISYGECGAFRYFTFLFRRDVSVFFSRSWFPNFFYGARVDVIRTGGGAMFYAKDRRAVKLVCSFNGRVVSWCTGVYFVTYRYG